MKRKLETAVVCIVGLGYIGLPLAKAFSKKLRVIGFDTDVRKVKQLNHDALRTMSNESETPPNSDDFSLPVIQNLTFTNDPGEIRKADFIIICVATPVTPSKEPDLSFVESAAEIVGRNMKKGSIVILESTVYPGVTEEIVKPILEKESGLKCGEGFKIAYSPERINPGDKEHTIDKITKVVAGIDKETTELVAELYRNIAPKVFKAKGIKIAEAAKVIENIQRDLNIALMNELAIIFGKMELNTKDVLNTAATKWNFHWYSPGLVGGHCIPVDPYYLVYKAKQLNYHPQVVLAGRSINDYMPKYVAEMTIKALNEAGKVVKGSKVLILGLTYKEDVPDIRESPVKGIIKELKDYKAQVFGFDPLLSADDFEGEFGIRLFRSFEEAKKEKFDCIILTLAHSAFRELTLAELREMQKSNPVLTDVRGIFSSEEARKKGFYYKTL